MAELDQAIERSLNDWYHPMARDDRRILATELKRLHELIEHWRKHPAISLDDDGLVIIHMNEIEGRDNARVAEYRQRTWDAEKEVERLEKLDDRIRDAMDGFDYEPHTCEESRCACVPCLLIELNKALLPGWSPPDGHAAVRPTGH